MKRDDHEKKETNPVHPEAQEDEEELRVKQNDLENQKKCYCPALSLKPYLDAVKKVAPEHAQRMEFVHGEQLSDVVGHILEDSAQALFGAGNVKPLDAFFWKRHSSSDMHQKLNNMRKNVDDLKNKDWTSQEENDETPEGLVEDIKRGLICIPKASHL